MTYASSSTSVVRSSDGTAIAYRTVGSGPGVIVVPGSLAVASDYDGFAQALSAHHFTVHTIERRGRGESGDGDSPYALAREREDLGAVKASTGAGFVFGHSFGGLVALEAASSDPTVGKVAVYDPGIVLDEPRIDWVERCRSELAAGRGLDALATFAGGVNPETTGRVPRPLLKAMLVLAMRADEREQKYRLLPTALREHAEAVRLAATPARYGDIAADVLLLAGRKGPARRSEEALERLLPVLRSGELIAFPKLDHFGPQKHPQEVAAAVASLFA